MDTPDGFSWVDKPLLAGMSRPESVEEYHWLRQQGIQLLVSLSEEPPRRDWINEAGLFLVHVPVDDFTAPTQDQLDQCLTTIERAHEKKWGVGVHCRAGLGRTGTVLACYFVAKNMSPANAMARVRRLRPGSIENEDQEDAVVEFARRRGHPDSAARGKE
jgi:atypical dual specificity phosphatase